MREVVAAIEAAAPEMRDKVTFEEKPPPFPGEVNGALLARVIGPLPITPQAEGAWRLKSRQQKREVRLRGLSRRRSL